MILAYQPIATMTAAVIPAGCVWPIESSTCKRPFSLRCKRWFGMRRHTAWTGAKGCKVVEKISRPPAKNAHSAGKLKKRPTRDVGAGFSRPDAMGFGWRHANPPTLSLALAWDLQRQTMETTGKPAWVSWYANFRSSILERHEYCPRVLDRSLKTGPQWW